MEKERGIIIKIDDILENSNQDDVQESFKNLSLALGELTASINNQFSEIGKQVAQAVKSIVEGIDFSQLSKVQQTYIQNVMKMLQQGWELEWFLPDTLVEVLLDSYGTFTEDYEFDEQIIMDYFDENFDFLSNQAINHPFYENHRELLLDSKKLFVENRFAISAYPLFSAIDNIFTRWITKPDQFHLDNNTTYISGEKKRALKREKENFNPIQSLNILHLSIYSAHEGYLYYFKNSNNRNALNRNIYMHGNYSYGLMDKNKCLKLWSFLVLCIDFIEEIQSLKKNDFQRSIVE